MAIYNNETDPNILMWEQLEKERQETLSDPKYREWVVELNVSRSYVNRDSIHKANDMNADYNFSKLNKQTNDNIFNNLLSIAFANAGSNEQTNK
jgi:hypothetical protein